MLRRNALAHDVSLSARDAAPPSRSAPASFDATTFDKSYFGAESNYGGRYDWYNPPHKIAGYLREIRAVRPGGALLDVGCAFGRFLEQARAHYRCEGMDISAYALEAARRRLPDIPLTQGRIEDFRPGGRYDVVTCFDVLEHVPDLDLALGRLANLLAPSGVLAIAVPVYDSPPGWAFGLLDRDATHVHRHGRRFWLRRLPAAGLRPIVFKGILRVPLPGGLFLHFISGLFRFFSSAIFVIAERVDRPPAS
ncbi:MAG TPA: class I SAM-dependent methyltransferase [bacterium]|jgi:SAM-dependent methyltransferase|nr:class I SAM-dependent methyltransferase [bacterium]